MTARRIRAHSGSASVQPVTPFGSDVQNERFWASGEVEVQFIP